jgi:hypothetical protein
MSWTCIPCWTLLAANDELSASMHAQLTSPPRVKRCACTPEGATPARRWCRLASAELYVRVLVSNRGVRRAELIRHLQGVCQPSYAYMCRCWAASVRRWDWTCTPWVGRRRWAAPVRRTELHLSARTSGASWPAELHLFAVLSCTCPPVRRERVRPYARCRAGASRRPPVPTAELLLSVGPVRRTPSCAWPRAVRHVPVRHGASVGVIGGGRLCRRGADASAASPR